MSIWQLVLISIGGLFWLVGVGITLKSLGDTLWIASLFSFVMFLYFAMIIWPLFALYMSGGLDWVVKLFDYLPKWQDFRSENGGVVEK